MNASAFASAPKFNPSTLMFARLQDRLTPPRDMVFPLRLLGGKPPLIELWDTSHQGGARKEYSTVSLAERIKNASCIPPNVFIFHCGRCGSTLLARLFSATPANRVFNEPGPIQQFRDLYCSSEHQEATPDLLEAVVKAHGIAPNRAERQVIIKLNSRAVSIIDILLDRFPSSAFIYLIRDPAEVIESFRASPASYLDRLRRADMASEYGITDRPLSSYTNEQWYAWYVFRNMDIAIKHAHKFTAVIDYSTFQSDYLPLVNRLSGTDFEATTPQLAQVFGSHAKNISRPFARTSTACSEQSRVAAAQIAGATYSAWKEFIAYSKG